MRSSPPEFTVELIVVPLPSTVMVCPPPTASPLLVTPDDMVMSPDPAPRIAMMEPDSRVMPLTTSVAVTTPGVTAEPLLRIGACSSTRPPLLTVTPATVAPL